MSTRAPDRGGSYPRAPSQEEWTRLSEEERARVVESLPAAMTDAETSPPEGDQHYDARETLREWFRRRGERVYVAAELTVYCHGESRFAPDVLAVRDVEPHDRTKWVVSAEGKGLDWVLEVHFGGDRKKDAEANVVRYARVGIPEYFVYDRARQRLAGYRLAPGERSYRPIVPQLGRYRSDALSLELVLEGGRLRFYSASAELLTPRDLADKLGRMVPEIRGRARRRGRERARRRGRARGAARRAREKR